MTEAADRSAASALAGVGQLLGLALVVVTAAIAFAFAAVAAATIVIFIAILAGVLHLIGSDQDSGAQIASGWVVEASAAHQA
jgi:cobalamin synthase